jgi:FixJ family two-component response regulator
MISDKECFYIVDDDQSVCRALKILLDAHGLNARSFGSAEDFLFAVPNGVPGCLILDIHLPGMNGWETQKRLVDSGSKRPVIFISADDDGEMMKRAYAVGAVGYLQKPFTGNELAALLRLVP